MVENFWQYNCRRNTVNYAENVLISKQSDKCDLELEPASIKLFDDKKNSVPNDVEVYSSDKDSKKLSGETLATKQSDIADNNYMIEREQFQQEGKIKLLETLELLMSARENYQNQLDANPNSIVIHKALQTISARINMAQSLLEFTKYKYETDPEKIDKNKLSELYNKFKEVVQNVANPFASNTNNTDADVCKDNQSAEGVVINCDTLESVNVNCVEVILSGTSIFNPEIHSRVETDISSSDQENIGNHSIEYVDTKTDETSITDRKVTQGCVDANSEIFSQLFQELQSKGYSEEVAEKIAGKYFEYLEHKFARDEAISGVSGYANFYDTISRYSLSNENANTLMNLYNKYFIETKSAEDASLLATKELEINI